LPAIIGSPLGGAIADRWHRQHWIQFNNAIMMLTASALAVLEITHHLTPLDACGLALIEGLSGSSSWTAWQSLLRDLVDHDEVMAAVSLSSAQFNLGRIIGPVAAGIALAVGSPGICFAANAASFAFVVVTFAFVRTPKRAKPTTKFTVLKDTFHGAKVAWATPECRNAITAIAMVAFCVSPFISLVPAMAIEVLHGSASSTSWLVTAQGVGAVIGALTLPAVAKRTSRLFVLRGSLVVVIVSEILYGVSPTQLWAVAALVFLGASYLGVLTGLNTSVQLHAPANERSRILGLYTLSLSVFYPFGAMLQSWIARYHGVRLVMILGAGALAVLSLAIGLVSPGFWRRIGTTTEVKAVEMAD
jgi:predicted MFS family arabinose efflux permease